MNNSVRGADLDQHVASRVRAELADAEQSDRWLSLQTGITQATLSRRLAGHSSFTVAELYVIAQTLGVQVIDLIGPSA